MPPFIRSRSSATRLPARLTMTGRLLPSVGLASLLVVSASAPPGAEAKRQTQLACPSGHTGDNCLTAFTVDLDGDQKPDQVGLIFEPRLRLYHVVVYTHSGRSFWPFRGSLNRERDEVTLTSRSGGGDLRCRSWADGKVCGYPVRTHDVPSRVLYLSDSRHGDFVLYIPQAYGKDYNATAVFVVMPALGDVPRVAL
jgi:hypothetical protein